MQQQCIQLHGHSIFHHNILHPPCGTLQPLHGHCIHITGHFRRHSNHCSDTASNFMGTTSFVISYCIQLVGLCTTAVPLHKYSGAMQGTLHTAGSLHQVHEHCIHIQGNCRIHCNHCRISASTFMGTASSVIKDCIPFWHTASTACALHQNSGTILGALQTLQGQCIELKGLFRCTAITAVSLPPPSWALDPPSQHLDPPPVTHHPHHGALQHARQPRQRHCIELKWHCRCSEITCALLHPPSWTLHPVSQHTASTFWDSASSAWALHPHSGTPAVGTANTAGSLHPPSWAWHPTSQHASSTLWGTAYTA